MKRLMMNNASLSSLHKLSCGIFPSLIAFAIIFPVSMSCIYLSLFIINLFITNSSLIGVEVLVEIELKLLAVSSSCRDVLLVAILDEQNDSFSNFSFSCCNICLLILSVRIIRRHFPQVTFLFLPIVYTEHNI